MASDDIYVRKDVYEADQRALIAEIKLGNEAVLKELRLFREEVNGRFSKLEARVEVLTGRIDALERRMGSLENFTTIGIGVITVLIALATFAMPISRAMRMFWKPRPPITLEQVEALINSKLEARK